MNHDRAVRLPGSIACQDEVGAARQRLADRLECLAAHEHGLPQGDGLEMFEVLGKPPRQGVVATDDMVARHRNHQRDHQHQISTAVLRTMTPLYGMRKNSAAWVL